LIARARRLTTCADFAARRTHTQPTDQPLPSPTTRPVQPADTSHNRTSEARRLARIRESRFVIQVDLSPANRTLAFRTPEKMRYLFAWWAQIRGAKD